MTTAELREYSLDEVKLHNKAEDLWMVIDGKVLNVTAFGEEHPGGEEVMVEAGGADATEAFEDIGHSDEAREMLAKWVIGTIKPSPKAAAAAAAAPGKPAAKTPTTAELKAKDDQAFQDTLMYLIPVVAIGAGLIYKFVL